MIRRPTRAAAVAAAAAFTLLVTASPVSAVPPPELVHSEPVEMGATTLTASFTDWPLRADRSLDFTFEPAGGIESHVGKLKVLAPNGESTLLGIAARLAGGNEMTLPRHPRDYNVWGLDAVALPEEGTWRFEFTVQGPEGTSTGTLALPVGPRPGPSSTLSWTIGLLPWVLAVPLLAYLWRRSRLVRRRIASDWSG
ncbi:MULTISPECIES: hypothetical protein [Streptomyces]|uniref:hypothetical protein n=1 Tax=Streptomyces sp. LRE541 TaxID=2931983 RepID=UPI0020106176|nr:hypothetical protein [Streptomyces sp. LRE541]UPZ26446.1 hypothetical protein MUK60_00660 [Streptomyces sp. LRE541]